MTLPHLSSFRNYRREWLLPDMIAGVSVCIVMIPAVIAYAGLMGIPPQHGLYAALIPLLVYPFFGSSKQMIVGPDIAISLLIASAITPLAQGANSMGMAAAVAILSGLLLILGGQLKLGAVAEFLSKPVLIGYMSGAALILMGSQLDKLFGIPLHQTAFVPRIWELLRHLGQTNDLTLLLGTALLCLIGGIRRYAPKMPPALAVVVVATLASWTLDLQNLGVAVVGPFPHGLPNISIPVLGWSALQAMLPAAIGISLLTYTEAILLARAFAVKNRQEVNANQELYALGLANIFTGLFQGFAVTGSQSRTTVNDSAGAKSQVSSLVAAAVLVGFLLFLTPLIAKLPTVSLAAILIYGGYTLIEVRNLIRIHRIYPHSAMLAVGTTLGVLVIGVVPGILIGVAFSLLGLIRRLANPSDAVLTEIPGKGFHDLGAKDGRTLPGFVAYRFYAPLLFSNISYFIGRIRQIIASDPDPVCWFLLDAQAVTDIDLTAAEALATFRQELADRGIALKIAHANRPLLDVLKRAGLAEEIQHGSFFHSVHECVAAYKENQIEQAEEVFI